MMQPSSIPTAPFSWLSLKGLCGLCLFFAVLLVLANLGVWLALSSDWLTAQIFSYAGTFERLPDAMTYHTAVMDFYYHDTLISTELFTQREIDHFADVKFWVQGSDAALKIGVFVSLITAVVLRKSAAFYVYKAGWAWLGVIVALMVLASVAWILFFRGWHPIFFSGGNWDFNPHTHKMLMLYNHAYLGLTGAVILLATLIPSLVILSLGWQHHLRLNVNLQQLRTWYNNHLKVAGVIAAVAAVTVSYHLGQQMIEPTDTGWYYFYGVSIALVTAVLVLFLVPIRVPQLLFLSLGVLHYYAFNLGVRESFDACKAFEEKLQPLIAQIETYKRENGTYPRHINEELVALGATVSPVNTDVNYTRYKLKQGGKRKVYFSISFRGPLASDYSYLSHRQTWLHVKRP